ncbi:MAG: S1/P1 nuclease [Lysobacter sp.]|nr:S1/P1 nuclease [Lysobacter sp.]
MPRLPVLLVLLLLSPAAFAWSALGHRLVGAIAERHLDPAAAREVHELLQGEPDPTLAGVATWADELRNTDPARFKATSRWHYIDTDDAGCHFDPPRDCPDGQCVTAAIAAQERTLADRSQPLAARRDALKFLVHFIGDVHQPMHANHHGDKGGNDYQISLRTDLAPEAYARNRYVDGVMGTNLHAVWDYYVLGSLGLDLPHYTARLDALPWPPLPGSVPGPMAWAEESCRLVDARGLYPPGHTLDRGYLDTMRPLAEQRIRQAAWRLTDALDQALR